MSSQQFTNQQQQNLLGQQDIGMGRENLARKLDLDQQQQNLSNLKGTSEFRSNELQGGFQN